MDGKLLCYRCVHLVWVDGDGNIKCAKGMDGEVKTYCRFFESVKLVRLVRGI
jgi:hypothetical protein